MKANELTGAALDWAVAKCEGYRIDLVPEGSYTPSTDWAQGGPIIEREGILLRSIRRADHSMDGQWLAMYDGGNTGSMVQWVKRETWPRHYFIGPTPLIAAMRCYVASKLGDGIEIPKELT
jgi:hypothetical protein